MAHLSSSEALFEMNESARRIEQQLGERPRHFAYPYGSTDDAGNREFELAKEADFASAVTTRCGVIVPEHRGHMTALPRIVIDGCYQDLQIVKTLLSGVPGRIRSRGRKLNVS